MINTLLAALVTLYAMPAPSSTFPYSWQSATISHLMLDLFTDFFFYFGHTLSHENEWLWTNIYSVETPTPIATGWNDNVNTIMAVNLPTLAVVITI